MKRFIVAVALAGVLALPERAAAQYLMRPGDISGPGWYYSPQFGVVRNPFNPPPPFPRSFGTIPPPPVVYLNGTTDTNSMAYPNGRDRAPGRYENGYNNRGMSNFSRPGGWWVRDPYPYRSRW